MKLFLISQIKNNDYDTFDSAVVAADSEEIARQMNPYDGNPWTAKESEWTHDYWCDPLFVKVEYIGEASLGVKQGVICASFNAG